MEKVMNFINKLIRITICPLCESSFSYSALCVDDEDVEYRCPFCGFTGKREERRL